jgi:hypothetical protein
MQMKRTYFQDEWLHDKEFKGWVQRGSDNEHFRCVLCKKDLALTNMGAMALKKHEDRKKHKERVSGQNEIGNFFQPSSESTPSPASASSATSLAPSFSASVPSSLPATSTIKASAVKQLQVPYMFDQESRVKAEIIWSLYCVQHNYSDNSSDGIAETFQAMFPGTVRLQLQPTKLGYIVKFGLGPYVKNLLTEEISGSKWVSVSYDESLNKKTQECQMDVGLRYWYNDRVQNRYWHSEFLGHSCAGDLLREFNKGLEGVNTANITHISMDGPAVN